ncbi:Uncharacterised protein [uncultured Eubacterium sp.]|nr:Uncharacterised protein [uncultured Eubacterium sp.]
METDNANLKKTTEIKQVFLASAISDISSYIQLSDTKVSIIMAAMVALVAAAISCYEPLAYALGNIKPCSWLGAAIIFLSALLFISVVAVFVFGILTIRGHSSNIRYKSKWFLTQSTKEYSFDVYKRDVQEMTDEEIIENMSAELYKLNDINRQKLRTNRWVIRSFSSTLITAGIICILIIIFG